MYESYWTCCKKKKGDKTHKGYSGLATYVKNENKIICSTNNVFDDFSFFFNDYIKKEDLLIKKKSEIDKTSISFFLLNDNKKIYNDQNIKCDKNDEHNKKKNKTNISVSEFFNEGRILITMHKHFIIVNIYAPYSGHNYERLYYKVRFFHAVRAKIIQLRIVTGLPIILLGDFNISYRNKDIYYLNNIINLDILLKNIHNIDLKEDIKMKIIKNIPLIINTLKDEHNFIIKKYKIQNNELYNLYLKFDTHVKFIGNNFSSVEEILYFFSLDPVYVHDKYKDYPYEYYFVVNNVSDDFHDVFKSPTDSNINVSNNKNDHPLSSTNKDDHHANSIGEPSSPPCCVDIIKNLIYEDNMIDTFSFFHPNVNGKFTCWDTYRQCRVHNEGSRIDYIFMDYILYEHFIKRNTYLYESPVILNHELYEMLKQKLKKKNSLNYHDMNSFQTNQYYANYFNKIKTKQKYLLSNDNINDTSRKKKNKQEKDEEQDEHKLEDQIQDAEFYKFQFKISTYIGFIYTSPKLSDHIAVKCTFIKNYNRINYNNKNKIIIKLCSSRFNIILNYLCTSINQYIMYLPLFLINPSLFSLTTYTLLDHVHLYDGLCPNILNTQPHKKTNKITQYFTLKKKK
ncbi:hypothetical protein PFFCH_03886 [Plasmodium falciparum FCH/4]|uniref:Endonuclease/exonuclease/phosphatase domain-containing protein n=1 Tax=Plasmodium falciparum FCH/4 TaxID=1036724 RepID=A0A024VJQ9_PLAFA|nr:hypothetical protein PFFCH_03886 [Plasmodium falciparum FCH/4]